MPFFGIPIRNGLPIGLGSVAGFGVAPEFSPADLFLGGVNGAWYDPSDSTTLFSDTAGTTPVAQPGAGAQVVVGAMLDKRVPVAQTGYYSGVFDGSGDYLSVPDNAAFDFGAGEFTAEAWVYGTSGNVSQYTTICSQSIQNATSDSAWFFSAGTSGMTLYLSTSGNSWTNFIEINSGITNNQWFHVAFQRRGNTLEIYRNGVLQTPTSGNSSFSGTVFNSSRTPFIGAQQASPSVNHLTGYISNLRIVKGTAVYTANFTPPTSPLTAISGTSLLTCQNATFIDNSSNAFAITANGDAKTGQLSPFGNHAISYNSTTARPELSARVNLLTYSEQFDNAVWQTSFATKVSTTQTDPNGGSTAALITIASGGEFYQDATLTGGSGSFSVYVKKPATGGATAIRLTTNNRAAWNTGLSTKVTLTSDWQRVVLSGALVSSGSNLRVDITCRDATSAIDTDCIGDVLVAFAQLIQTNAFPANTYQRIADQYTYDNSASFPRYLRFDGVDDGMSTPANLDLTSTDKATVFAGVRKLSDAAAGIIVENFDTTPGGVISLSASPSSTAAYFFRSAGTADSSGATPTSYTAPISNVLTGIGEISTDVRKVRVNGVEVVNSSTDQGTGNYANRPITIGYRSSLSLWLNGQLYSLIVRGAATDAGTISATEQWVAGKTGIVVP